MPTRTVPMEVLCLGMGRTGTQSLADALPLIGIKPIYHMRDVRANSHNDAWSALLSAKKAGKTISVEDFDEILGAFAGTTDWPSVTFATDLITAYPTAKIILTTRDEEAWLKSMNSTLFAKPDTIPPSFFSQFKDFHFGEDGERGEGNVDAKLGFRRHNEEVKRWAEEKGREVLVYEVKEGWGPLCAFLGREEPLGVEFPRSDDWAVLGWKKGVEEPVVGSSA